MPPAKAVVSRIVEGPPRTVYEVLADYTEHHPRILPRPPFGDLVVEAGGRGAGTRFRVSLRVLGTTTTLRMRVTEPTPGTVLREEDPDAGVTTTFTLTPEGAGDRTRVEIATEWKERPGLRGAVERWVNPRVARPLYEKELALVDAYVRERAREAGRVAPSS